VILIKKQNMTPFNKIKLENTFLVEHAEILFSKRFIEKEQFHQIKMQLSQLNSSSFFIRVGFFLLGCFLISSVLGFISVLSMSILNENYSFQMYLGMILCIIGSELLSRKEYYKHGLNDAFILSIPLFASIAIGLSTESVPFALVVLALSSLGCVIRYLHTTSALVSCIGFLSVLSYLVTQEHLINKAYLPFLGLFLGLLLFLITVILSKNENAFQYKNALLATKVFSLLLIYFSMNYLVVRELSEILMNIKVTKGNDIPFAVLFYLLTFLIPVFYILFGLNKKDRIFLLIGMSTFAFSIFTIRYYYAILPIETALVIGGIILFGLIFLAIQKLKNFTTGLTFQPDRGNDSSFILHAQAFLVTSQVNTQAPAVEESKMPFGGGGFSGGGAGESF
jgi:hypothetical protein